MMSIHTCSYYCDRPECIKAQRDELRGKMPAPNMRLVPVSLLNEILEGRQNAETFTRLTKIVDGE